VHGIEEPVEPQRTPTTRLTTHRTLSAIQRRALRRQSALQRWLLLEPVRLVLQPPRAQWQLRMAIKISLVTEPQNQWLALLRVVLMLRVTFIVFNSTSNLRWMTNSNSRLVKLSACFTSTMMDGRSASNSIALNKVWLLEHVFRSSHVSLVQLLVLIAQARVVQV
jgi:hypothetical protein